MLNELRGQINRKTLALALVLDLLLLAAVVYAVVRSV